ncbi:MAG: hypothetical protein DWQ36_04475 [Acidobacteria bacterium]|nr:MAG: hypothetical protein DWQ30_22035 [Acidobacteriota bacterium]REK10410.1 MAG: hypothetical protein DWQ36_04475 [Acidobacteriota bacterium]
MTPSLRSSARRGALSLLPMVLAAWLAAACGDDGRGREATVGAAVWWTPEERTEWTTQRLEAGRLRRSGIAAQFLDAASTQLDGTLIPADELARAGRRSVQLPVHLVVRSRLLASTPEEWGETLATSLRGLRLDLGNRGDDLAGVLLWIEDLELGEAQVAALRRLRRELEDDLALGVLAPDDVAASEVARQTGKSFDYAVVELYGQPPDQADMPIRWELSRALPRLRELVGLGVPLRAVVRCSGRLVAASNGTVLDLAVERAALRAAAGSVDGAFRFEGYDRQVFSFTFPSGFEPGESPSPRAGSALRISRPTAQHVGRALRSLAELDAGEDAGGGDSVGSRVAPILAGFVDAQSAVGIGLEEALDVLVSGPRPPRLELEVEGGGSRLRVALANRGGPTGVGQVRFNFVDVTVDGGVVAQVDPGEFPRYSLGGSNPSSRSEMRLGSARIARLAVPLLEQDAELRSGYISIRGSRPRIEVQASFVDPLGNRVESSPWIWPSPPEESR